MANSLIRRNHDPLSLFTNANGFGFEPFLSALLDDFLHPSDAIPARTSERRNVITKSLDDSYEILIAAPGIKKGDFKISLENSQLNVSYTASDDGSPRVFFKQAFSRSWTVSSAITVEDISAQHENGILTITVKKPEAETVKIQTIDVQ